MLIVALKGCLCEYKTSPRIEVEENNNKAQREWGNNMLQESDFLVSFQVSSDCQINHLPFQEINAAITHPPCF